MKKTLTLIVIMIPFLFTNAQNNPTAQLLSNMQQATRVENITDDKNEQYVRVNIDVTNNIPMQFNTNCTPFQLPFTENFDDESVACWTIPEGVSNWSFGEFYTPPSTESGAPNAFFNWSPNQSNYSHSLTSPLIDATNFSEVKMDFLLLLNNFSSATLEQMSVEYKAETDETWTLLEVFNNQGPTNIIEFIREDQELVGMAGRIFQIRFRAHGIESLYINGWGLDDVLIYGTANEMLLGDANCDDTVDVLDVITTINDVLELNPDPFCFNNADWNGDEIIDVLDVIGIIGIILGDTGGGGDEFVCGTSTITDADDNVYNTVLIGDQCWMKENLQTTKYRDGTDIQFPEYDDVAWSTNTTGAYTWYNNNVYFKDFYGALYNWFTTVNPLGLCPGGWHVPTDEEFVQLTEFIGGTSAPYGNQLKSCRQVGSPLGGDCNTTQQPRWSSHETHFGTDDHGFSALPGGYRNPEGNFSGLEEYGGFWTASESSSTKSFYRYILYRQGNISKSSFDKPRGLSIRCVRDSD